MAIADKIFRGDLWQRDCATVINALQTDIRADLPDNTVITVGTWTPTLTNAANISASTAYLSHYARIGTMVICAGRVDLDPTLAATSTQLGISLPIASNFGNSFECGGTANAPNIAGQSAAIIGDTTNDRAELRYLSGDVTNQPFWFVFMYRII